MGERLSKDSSLKIAACAVHLNDKGRTGCGSFQFVPAPYFLILHKKKLNILPECLSGLDIYALTVYLLAAHTIISSIIH